MRKKLRLLVGIVAAIGLVVWTAVSFVQAVEPAPDPLPEEYRNQPHCIQQYYYQQQQQSFP